MSLARHLRFLLPEAARNWISNYRERLRKRAIAREAARIHARSLSDLQHKGRIRVLFLVIHASVWKVDAVFRRMREDPLFEPEILICPCTSFSEEDMLREMDHAYESLAAMGYAVRKAWRDETGAWVSLSEFAPDVIFFGNPHKLTSSAYYEDAYSSFLSCYVPYAYEVSHYDNQLSQYNQRFHNAMWLIFAPHECSRQTYSEVREIGDRNVVVTGYPAWEDLLGRPDVTRGAWRPVDGHRLKVIWAPHHTIDMEALPYSNFLRYADRFWELATVTEGRIQWSFKPHPILKAKLYQHPEWGPERTDAYFEFWRSGPNTQLDEGPYAELFIESDALIHDSGSFLAEYLHLGKPVLYLIARDNYREFYNAFGLEALHCCRTGFEWKDVETFVGDLLDGGATITDAHRGFLEQYHHDDGPGVLPSEMIVEHLRDRITNGRV